MKETTNLKLKKYDYTDNVDMSTGHNLNMDIIDTEITNVKNSVNDIKLTSDKVTRPNSKTVEESIVANETSISELQNQIGAQITRAKTILTSLSSKVE